jgi:hypothetical protein
MTNNSIPMAFAACPANLPERGSWCTWLYCNEVFSGDSFYGIPVDPLEHSFTGEVRDGSINPTFDPPYSTGAGLYPRFIGSSADNTQHWTIRPEDSIAVTKIVNFPTTGDFYYRADQAVTSIELWHLFQMSWIVGTAASMAIDDVPCTLAFEPEPFTGFWYGDVQDDGGAIAPAPPDCALVVGISTHMDWWLTTEFIDWNLVANRRRFITADRKRVSISENGSSGSPTGRKPEFYFRPKETLADFSQNRGTGGPIVWTTTGDYPDPITPNWTKAKAGTGAG